MVRWRWRSWRRICACQARASASGGTTRLVGAKASRQSRRMPVVPGGFDQEAAGVAVAGLGHRAAEVSVAGGVLGDGEAEEAHQLAGGGEAAEVADLGEQRERGQRRDAAEAGEPADRVAPRMARSDLLELTVDGRDLRVERVEVAEHLLERGLRERVVERFAGAPRRGAGASRPSSPRGRCARSAAAACRPGAVRRCGPGAGRRGSAPGHAALLLRRRRPNERELAGPVEPDELARVTTVGLHPVARPYRDQRRRDDVAGHTHRREQPVQLIAARAGLVTDREPLAATQAGRSDGGSPSRCSRAGQARPARPPPATPRP